MQIGEGDSMKTVSAAPARSACRFVALAHETGQVASNA